MKTWLFESDPPLHAANLVANSANIARGVESIDMAGKIVDFTPSRSVNAIAPTFTSLRPSQASMRQ